MEGVPPTPLVRDVDSKGIGEKKEGEGLPLRRCYQAATAHFTRIFFSKMEASLWPVLIISIIILIKFQIFRNIDR